jgi:hypothetical protein
VRCAALRPVLCEEEKNGPVELRGTGSLRSGRTLRAALPLNRPASAAACQSAASGSLRLRLELAIVISCSQWLVLAGLLVASGLENAPRDEQSNWARARACHWQWTPPTGTQATRRCDDPGRRTGRRLADFPGRPGLQKPRGSLVNGPANTFSTAAQSPTRRAHAQVR